MDPTGHVVQGDKEKYGENSATYKALVDLGNKWNSAKTQAERDSIHSQADAIRAEADSSGKKLTSSVSGDGWEGTSPFSSWSTFSASATDRSVTLITGSAGFSQVSFDNGVTLNAFGVQTDVSASIKKKGISIYGKVYGAQATINKGISLPLISKKLNISLTGDYASLGGGFIVRNGLKLGFSVGVGFDLSFELK